MIIISILSYHFTFLFRFPQFHLNSVFGMIHLDSYFAIPIFVIFWRRATADTAIVFQIGPFSYSTLFCSMSIENKAEAVSFFIAHFLGQKREKRILQLADIFCFEPEKFWGIYPILPSLYTKIKFWIKSIWFFCLRGFKCEKSHQSQINGHH